MAEAADRVGVVADFVIDKFKANAAEYNHILGDVDRRTMEAAQRMQASGFAYAEIENTLGKAATAQLEYAVDVDRASQALAEHKDAQEQVAAAAETTTGKVEKQGKAFSFNLKKIVLWGVGAASMYRLYMKIRRAAAKFIAEVIKGTPELEKMTAASTRLKAGLAAAFGDEILGGVRSLTDVLVKAEEGVKHYTIQMEANAAVVRAAGEGYDLLAFYIGTLFHPIEEVIEILGLEVDYFEELTKAQEKYNTGAEEFINKSEEQAEASAKMSRAMQEYQQTLSRVVDMGFRAGEGLAQYMEQVGEAFQRHQQDQADAWQDYYDEIEDINADAIAAREKAWKSYYSRIEKLQLAGRRREASDAARHALRVEHARRRYTLTLLQNERMYQYSRRRLVGEGDVLAIEDLDARYELERQAQEENFQLQMWQMEQMAQLQRRINQEAMRDQIAALRAALNEQLQEIEENRRDKLVEAEESRDEQLFVAEQTYDQSVAAAKKGYDEWQRAEAEHWAKLALQAGLGLDEITTLVRGAYGAGSPMEQYVSDWFARIRAMYAAFAAQLAPMFLPPALPMLPPGRTRGYQHGGEFVATQPTTIMVGEGGAPERVSIQPMSSIGGALSVGWSGGAIPVHGTGSMDGADLSQIGETIGTGLMVALRDTVLSYRGVRGS